MLLPHRPLLVALIGWLALALLAVWREAWLPLWQWSGALLAGIALADAGLALRRGNPVTVEREMAKVWPVGKPQTIHLHLSSPERAVTGWVFDRHPDAFPALELPLPFRTPQGGWVRLGYTLHPTERGDHAFGPTELRLLSPLKLWLTQHASGAGETVRVYPDFARVAEYALLATDHRLAQWGVLPRRRRGEGLDFHQLREYRRDDPTRCIDWKATAKRRKPIVREYQDERDQRVVFLLDCGQRMRAKDGALSHLDHTLDAVLLLAHAALRQGDAVGFASFAHPGPRFFAPRKSLETLRLLAGAVYDLQPSLQVPDYLAAALDLTQRLDRRALVVLLTNLRDEDSATLPPALRHLGRRHPVLIANLREGALDAALERPVEGFEEALGYAAAVDYRRGRRRQWAELRAQGASLLDVAPQDLPVALVNRYWELKRGGAL
jgi:uncharacterized protein (DUF58 family)